MRRVTVTYTRDVGPFKRGEVFYFAEGKPDHFYGVNRPPETPEDWSVVEKYAGPHETSDGKTMIYMSYATDWFKRQEGVPGIRVEWS